MSSSSRGHCAEAARLACVGILVLAAAGSCARYRCGTVGHPELKTVAVTDFGNDTNEARLGTQLQKCLAEHFTVDSALRLTHSDTADAVVSGRVLGYRLRQVAAGKRRDSSARDRDSDAYQATVFRTEVDVEFQVEVPGRTEPLVGPVTVSGAAVFSHLPDLNTARQEGLDRAVNDAAVRMVAALTEAW